VRRGLRAVPRAAAAALWVTVAAAGAQQPPRPAVGQLCVTCHGANGLSVAPDAPNLAGQPEIYLSTQLRAYRSGKRTHEVMNVVARNLSDEDIAALSGWFAAFRIEVRAGP
jgi:cytochrome c553